MYLQGFATGDAEVDAYAIRKFVADGHAIMLSQSFAKNFGLYGERVGCFSLITSDADECARVNSQVCSSTLSLLSFCLVSPSFLLSVFTFAVVAAKAGGSRDVLEPSHPRRPHRGPRAQQPRPQSSVVPGVQGHGGSVSKLSFIVNLCCMYLFSLFISWLLFLFVG